MSLSGVRPVVFIHGLWMHSSSWDPWVELFSASGYRAQAPGWPGDGPTPEATRANPDDLNNRGVAEVTAHYTELIAALPTPPVVIGHSFGGLIAQQLLAAGSAAACVAIAPAQFKGVLALPPAQLRSALPVLGKPWLRGKTWAHSADSYHRSFANGVPREESDRLFADYAIPAPAKPLFQAAVANFVPGSEAQVDTAAERGPLLMFAGGLDRTVPVATVRAAHKLQSRNPGVTELVVLPDRCHSMSADHGWRELADTALQFLEKNLPDVPPGS
ncbi:alpha/beta hydrolase [Nocardia noduli]|uniref:alpha/beta hydrolase n=1 Tax=Nocardia noduli TaxID=2815722 RepID=UPI0027E20776|nr:alpha/beta hydrolase [Nocardia noduli]